MAIAIEAVNLIPPPLSSPIATLPAFGRVDSVQSVNYVQSLPNVIKLIKGIFMRNINCGQGWLILKKCLEYLILDKWIDGLSPWADGKGIGKLDIYNKINLVLKPKLKKMVNVDPTKHSLSPLSYLYKWVHPSLCQWMSRPAVGVRTWEGGGWAGGNLNLWITLLSEQHTDRQGIAMKGRRSLYFMATGHKQLITCQKT